MIEQQLHELLFNHSTVCQRKISPCNCCSIICISTQEMSMQLLFNHSISTQDMSMQLLFHHSISTQDMSMQLLFNHMYIVYQSKRCQCNCCSITCISTQEMSMQLLLNHSISTQDMSMQLLFNFSINARYVHATVVQSQYINAL